jgi:hypothetical protein
MGSLLQSLYVLKYLQMYIGMYAVRVLQYYEIIQIDGDWSSPIPVQSPC